MKVVSRFYNWFTTRFLSHSWHPQQKTLNNTHMHVKYDFPWLYHRCTWQVNLAVRKEKELRHVSYTSKEWGLGMKYMHISPLTIYLKFFTSKYILNIVIKLYIHQFLTKILWMLSLVLFSTISIFFREYISFFFTVSIFFGFWWLIYLLAPVTFYHLLHR